MNWVRKIDFYFQFAIIIVAVCAIPYRGIFALLFGQIFLGCLQVIGGGIHAFIQLPAIFQKAFKMYWSYVLIYFAFSTMMYFINKKMQLQSHPILIVQYLVIPWIIAGYYLWWYKKLIGHLDYHRELEGLIKS